MRILLFLTIFLFRYSFVVCKLPPYIKPCSRSKPNFNECGLKNGKEAIPIIVQGDPSFHIPNFKPFKLDYVSVQAGKDIEISNSNLEIRGVENLEFTEYSWDFENKLIYIRVFIPVLNMQGFYRMKGRILIMELSGSGKMNNTHYDTDVKSYVRYSVIKKNGTEYMNIENVESKIKILKGVTLSFDNLLNNEVLSKQINSFLNENWQILLEDITPSLNAIFAAVTKQIIDPFTQSIPIDEIALP